MTYRATTPSIHTDDGIAFLPCRSCGSERRPAPGTTVVRLWWPTVAAGVAGALLGLVVARLLH